MIDEKSKQERKSRCDGWLAAFQGTLRHQNAAISRDKSNSCRIDVHVRINVSEPRELCVFALCSLLVAFSFPAFSE